MKCGLKCNCTCEHCRDRLIAKLGKIKVRHFTHSNSNCIRALESSLHIFAKQVLQENYTCRQCNENTNDWIIAYGDGPCICRTCHYK